MHTQIIDSLSESYHHDLHRLMEEIQYYKD